MIFQQNILGMIKRRSTCLVCESHSQVHAPTAVQTEITMSTTENKISNFSEDTLVQFNSTPRFNTLRNSLYSIQCTGMYQNFHIPSLDTYCVYQ